MDAVNLSRTINDKLACVDQQFVLANKAVNVIRIDLPSAKQHILAVDVALQQLAQAINGARIAGISTPPDVIMRYNTCYDGLQNMVRTILDCELIVSRHTDPTTKPN